MFLIPEDFYEIRETQLKGRGVFAKKNILAGTIIGDYLGKVVLDDEADRLEREKGLYTIGNTKKTCLFPSDINLFGMHTVNHSCTPNCFMYAIKDHVVYFALREIYAGEELTVFYLLPPARVDEPASYPCHCKSILCRGAMYISEEYFDRVDAFYQKNQGVYYENPETNVGEELQFLEQYPKSIEDNELFPMFANLQKEYLERGDAIMPPKNVLRELIRESGRKIFFPKLNICVFGILEDVIYLISV